MQLTKEQEEQIWNEFLGKKQYKEWQEYLPLPTCKIGNKEIHISQTLLKAYNLLQEGNYCPRKFKNLALGLPVSEKDSAVMAAGRRFEFELSGAKDRDGNEPARLLTPKKGAESAAQKEISESAFLAKVAMKKLGFETEYGALAGYRIEKAGMKGMLDWIVLKDGKECIVDIKYSALIGNKFEQHGWNVDYDTRNNLTRNAYHKIQAQHYQLLMFLKTGYLVDFYYAIFSSSKVGDYLIAKMNLTDATRAEHLHLVTECINYINASKFEASPTWTSCNGCIVENCESRLEFKPIFEVNFE